jgi:S-adenosylmethionine decarboxylase proenzyme
MKRERAVFAWAEKSASHSMIGSQVLLDLYECEVAHLDDLEWVKRTLVGAARAAGATIVGTIFHKFAPWGISGVVVIAESHLAIHIWPERRYAAVDVFTCGAKVRMDAASAFLTREFQSRRPMQRSFMRGEHVPGASESPRVASST